MMPCTAVIADVPRDSLSQVSLLSRTSHVSDTVSPPESDRRLRRAAAALATPETLEKYFREKEKEAGARGHGAWA